MPVKRILSFSNILLKYLSIIAGTLDGKYELTGTGASLAAPNTPLCSNVTIENTENEFGHWAVCKFPECPIVRITTVDEVCNYYSYYGNNPGFENYPLQIADINAVNRDLLIWQSQIKDHSES